MQEPYRPDLLSLIKRIPELEVESAMSDMGGSKLVYIKTLTHMVRQIPYDIGEMDDSLSKIHNLNHFAVQAHGIKSALRQVGNTELGNRAEALENAAKARDRIYCVKRYAVFKEDVLRFYEQVNAAIEQSGKPQTTPTSEPSAEDNIDDFINVIKRARDAADLCDSILAHEILFPLTEKRFGEYTDEWILKAVVALDQFRPFEALEYITELLNECGQHSDNDERRKDNE